MSQYTNFLHNLWAIIQQKKHEDPTGSWTAALLQKPTSKVAEKFGEEAVETLIAAMDSSHPDYHKNITAESADCLYHLLVLWEKCGVSIDDVAAELERRQAQSGLAEKQSRPS